MASSRIPKICIIPDCKNQQRSPQGWCSTHVYRFETHGSFDKPVRQHSFCSVDGCDERITGRGLCEKHYYRQRKHGNPMTVAKKMGRGATQEARFWDRVALTANPDKCWLWQGQKSKESGYGSVSFEGKARRAHVVSWRLATGYYPALQILHSCDVRLCVNPVHLHEGTQADNMREMSERGRSLHGTKNPKAKLTEDNVRLARELHSQGHKFSPLARRFGVCKGVMRDAILGITWRHVK